MREALEACRCLQMFANRRETLRRKRISREGVRSRILPSRQKARMFFLSAIRCNLAQSTAMATRTNINAKIAKGAKGKQNFTGNGGNEQADQMNNGMRSATWGTWPTRHREAADFGC
jgi:hypothetical protein